MVICQFAALPNHHWKHQIDPANVGVWKTSFRCKVMTLRVYVGLHFYIKSTIHSAKNMIYINFHNRIIEMGLATLI